MEIITKRLRLIPCSEELMQGLINNDIKNANLNFADGWPLEDIKDALKIFLEWIKLEQMTLGWGMWLIILKDKNLVIGGSGFVGIPDKNASVEIGYSIAPEYRRQGYTYEANKALIKWAFDSKKVKTIKAKCEKDNIASIKLLEKLKMKYSRINSQQELEFTLKEEQDWKS